METATPSPLERGARALAKAQSGVDEWDALDEGFQATLKENVAAVLNALREPSEEMVEAAWDVMPDEIAGGPVQAPAPSVWTAIDRQGSGGMKLSGKTRLIVEVDPSVFLHAGQNRETLFYHLERLFQGESVAVEELASWGLTITEDDYISIPRMD